MSQVSTSGTAPLQGSLPWSLQGICDLSTALFFEDEALSILRVATESVPSIGSFRALATYRTVDGTLARCPPSQPPSPSLDAQVRAQNGEGRVELADIGWGWAFPLRTSSESVGSLVVASAHEPRREEIAPLTVLAQLTETALARAEAQREKNYRLASVPADTYEDLASTVRRLERRTKIQEVLTCAGADGAGEQGIADALAEITGLSVAVEDPFGNLRTWSGDGRPALYPKDRPQLRDDLMRRLAAHGDSLRIDGRVVSLVQPRTEILGTLSLIDPENTANEEHLFALDCADNVLAVELSHQRNLAEIELRLRRELVADLLSGTDNDSAFARAEALGHDLHGSHHVVVVHCRGLEGQSVSDATHRAAVVLNLQCIQGQYRGRTVLITADRPDLTALHQSIYDYLDTTTVVGMGSRCEHPGDFSRSFVEASQAVNIRLHSHMPSGATAFDELGFYRLIDAANTRGQAEGFMREWLGVLLAYDDTNQSSLVHTLSQYLECGGNYDDSSTALNIHRSTLRYRLGRIRTLTGFDLRDVDTRFNLQVATRAWQFLTAR